METPGTQKPSLACGCLRLADTRRARCSPVATLTRSVSTSSRHRRFGIAKGFRFHAHRKPVRRPQFMMRQKRGMFHYVMYSFITHLFICLFISFICSFIHSCIHPFHCIAFHCIPFHCIPFHSIPFHSIPFHSIHSLIHSPPLAHSHTTPRVLGQVFFLPNFPF